jgi:hypothetical protein
MMLVRAFTFILHCISKLQFIGLDVTFYLLQTTVWRHATRFEWSIFLVVVGGKMLSLLKGNNACLKNVIWPAKLHVVVRPPNIQLNILPSLYGYAMQNSVHSQALFNYLESLRWWYLFWVIQGALYRMLQRRKRRKQPIFLFENGGLWPPNMHGTATHHSSWYCPGPE